MIGGATVDGRVGAEDGDIPANPEATPFSSLSGHTMSGAIHRNTVVDPVAAAAAAAAAASSPSK